MYRLATCFWVSDCTHSTGFVGCAIMKIHLFIDSSFPVGMASAKRQVCYAKGLIAVGKNVEVHAFHRVHEYGENNGYEAIGTYEGIPYNYISGKYKHKSKLLRGLDWYVMDALRAFLYACKTIKRKDICFIYTYPLFPQILLLLAAKFKGAKTIKETCEHPLALGNVHSRWHRFCRWCEFHFVMPRYDGFVAISRDLEKFVNRYKSKRAQCIIVPILVENKRKEIDYSNQKSPYNCPYIIHTGTMYEQKDSISKILKAFALYKKEYPSDCKLVFTGPQANDKCNYLPLIKELGIEKDVELLGLVSLEELGRLQHFAALTIIYKSDNLQTRNCFPTKLGEMLINGIPVITTTVGDSNLYLKNGVSAYIFEPDDEDMLIRYIREVFESPQKARQIGFKGKMVAEKFFSPYFQGKRLSTFFQKL